MADLATRTAKMAGFIAAHKAANPEAAVYGLGYSNGANILASVMLKDAGLFDRAVLMHPLIPWQPDPNPLLRDKKVLITAGRRDPICPLPLTERLRDYFAEQGSAVELVLHDGGHDVRQIELTAIAAFLSA